MISKNRPVFPQCLFNEPRVAKLQSSEETKLVRTNLPTYEDECPIALSG